MIRGQGWPCLDTWVPWLCSGTSLMGHRHLPIMTCRGELALPPAPRLLIRGGQEIAWVLGDKSIRCLAGGRRARALPDRSLPISPSTGGLLQARPGSSGGDKCGTAACAHSHQAWLCQLAALLGWWAGKTQVPGCCCGEKMGRPCSPHFAVGCAQICAQIPTPAGGQGAGAGFAPRHRRWVPRGGHRVARGVYLQTGGSWHRAAGHQRDPAAYNVNYHHVIKSP